MFKRSLIAMAVAAVALGSAVQVTQAATPRAVSDCHYRAGSFGPKNDRRMNIGDMSVRNMGCGSAHKAITRGRLLRSGSIRRSGFRCYTIKRYRVRSTVLGADVRCVSRSRAFRFSWAT